MKPRKNKPKEVVIAGYKISGNHQNLESLILALKEENGINYCGRTSSGFQDIETQHKLISLLKPLTIEKSPLLKDTGFDAGTNWVKPVLVCEVNYKTMSPSGMIKDVEFLWLREDKNINEHVEKTA